MLDAKLCHSLSLLEIGHAACEYSKRANEWNFREIYQTDGLVQKLKFALPGEAASAQQEEGFYVILWLKQLKRGDGDQISSSKWQLEMQVVHNQMHFV